MTVPEGMKGINADGSKYLKGLKERGKESHVYHSHQSVGLEIAAILHDLEHKSLYIKMAKMHNPDRLLSLAKSVAEKRDVKNPGAYFMKLIQGVKKEALDVRAGNVPGKYKDLFKRI
jgi:hypothetical protein